MLTFDDGPMPWVTKSILDTLDSFCTKATFFAVGQMAIAYPKTVAEVLNRGHTLASHTYSHPYNLPRMRPDAAKLEIERGLAAVASVAGQHVAPLFRFPALADSQPLIDYLKSRKLATLTVDVVSNDSYIRDPKKLTDETLVEVDKHKGGIILFHDIKLATAKALPGILDGLQARGYSVVHIVANAPAEPLMALLTQPEPKAAPHSTNSTSGAGKHIFVPFYGSIAPDKDGAAAPRASVSLREPAGQRIYGWATTVGREVEDRPVNDGSRAKAVTFSSSWRTHPKPPYHLDTRTLGRP